MPVPLQITFQLLGTLTVEVAGRAVHDFRAQSVRALLAYLAIERDRPHEREHLCALLWPDAPAVQAQASLRQALHRLRAALEPAGAAEPLLATGSAVRLNPAYRIVVDSEAHSAAIAAVRAHRHRSAAGCADCAGLLRQALAAYRGELLAGFALATSLPFDDWLLLQRERLHDEHSFVLDTLAAHHERCGEEAEAVVLLRRWLALEPWREATHLRLAAAQWRAGSGGAARRQLQRASAALVSAGLSPGPELRALEQQIAGGAPPQRTSLPAGGTPFVGRAAELRALAELLANPEQRLVTLVGPGGAGKTRLALEAGRTAAPTFAAGAAFVSLAGLDPGASLEAALAESLGIPIDPARDAVAQLHAALADDERLLLLDNCEHLPACPALVAALLAAAPRLTVLATSRAPLGLRAEQRFPIDGLALGDALGAPDPLGYDAGALFVAAARRAAPAFDPSPEAEAIAALCRRLEGLPLAVELAAARTAFLAVAVIADAIRADIDALALHAPDLPPRHRSIRATLEWSWSLLSPAERDLLAALACFASDFSREDALAVCPGRAAELDGLVRHSLVRRAETSGRYALHALTRQFAVEHLAAGAAAVQARLRAHFLGRLCAAGSQAEQLAQDRLNIVAAWRSAVVAGDDAALLRAAEPLARLVAGHELAGAVELLHEAAVALRGRDDDDALAAILSQKLRLLRLSGQYERGVAVAEELIARSQTPERSLDRARGYLGRGALNLARRQFADARADLELAGALAEAHTCAEGHIVLAHSLLERAALIDVQQLPPDPGPARRALALYRGLGATTWEALATMRLGNYHRRASDYAGSLACRRAAFALAQAAGDRSVEVRVGNDLGEDLLHLGCYDEARAVFEQTIGLARAIGFPLLACLALEGLARACHHLGDQRRAQAMIAEALELERQHQFKVAIGYHRNTLGYAHEGAGERCAAREAYAAALDSWGADHAEARLEPRAGLLRLALAEGDVAAAAAEARRILPALGEHGLSDALEPLRVYWSCYLGLAAAADPQAGAVLRLAKRLLAQQAASIADEGLRHCFLINVAAHRAIAAAPDLPADPYRAAPARRAEVAVNAAA